MCARIIRPWTILAGCCLAGLVLASESLLVAFPLACVAAAYGGLEPGHLEPELALDRRSQALHGPSRWGRALAG